MKAIKKSKVDLKDGNDKDLEDQLEEVYVYYGEELEPQGRDYAGMKPLTPVLCTEQIFPDKSIRQRTGEA